MNSQRAAAYRARPQSPRTRDIPLAFQLDEQPTETSCGPTCLHAIYAHFGDRMPLERILREIPELEYGGTLAVMLGCHALAPTCCP